MKLKLLAASILNFLSVLYHDETGGFWLWRVFLSERSFTANQCTEVIDLPKRGIISNLIIETYNLSGTQKCNTFSQDTITKVEVIGNGSTVIQSLTGTQLQASQSWDDGQISADKELVPSGGCYAYFDIRFGRYVGDPLYALDCSKWSSLELKITYDVDAGATQGTTGFTDDYGKLSIYGLFSPDGAGLETIGYLKKAQKKTWTTVADATDELSLPTDYPFRRLIMLSKTKPTVIYQAFEYVTLDINDGARKPIDNMKGNDIMQLDLAMRGWPKWMHNSEYYGSGSTYLTSRVGWPIASHVFRKGSECIPQSIGVDRVTYAFAGGTANIAVWGWLPDMSMVIDLEKWSGGKHGAEAMLDVFGYDQNADIVFKHTQGVASKATSFVLEQYASHPLPV